jgi:hypothetical protein
VSDMQTQTWNNNDWFFASLVFFTSGWFLSIHAGINREWFACIIMLMWSEMWLVVGLNVIDDSKIVKRK